MKEVYHQKFDLTLCKRSRINAQNFSNRKAKMFYPKSKKDLFTVEILNFWEHQEKGNSNFRWFKMSSDFDIDDKLLSCNIATRFIFVSLLCKAARSSDSFVTVSHSSMASSLHIRVNLVQNAFEELQRNQIVACFDSPRKEKKRIDKNRKEKNRIEKTKNDVSFDLDAVYEKYPRKLGKAAGMKKLKQSIKTQADFDALTKAVDNYRRHCEVQKTESQFIKHFSTFANNWQDWVDPDESLFVGKIGPVGQGKVTQKTFAQIRSENTKRVFQELAEEYANKEGK